jgi:hypothetical protein
MDSRMNLTGTIVSCLPGKLAFFESEDELGDPFANRKVESFATDGWS